MALATVLSDQPSPVRAPSPARPTVAEVRAQTPAKFTTQSLELGLAAFFAAALLYCGAVVAVLLAPWWPLQIACAILTGLLLATLFVIGHDACHDSLTPYSRLNKLLAHIAFLPSWTPYSSWEFAHNRVHHPYTNLRGKDYAWAPLSKLEYDRLSRPRRWLERHYRSLWGLGTYYMIEYWLRHLIFPTQTERRQMKRPIAFRLDLALVFAFATAQVWGVCVWSGTLTPAETFWGPFTSIPALLLTTILLPFLVWNWSMAFAIFQHHTHPRVVWYGSRAERDFFAGQVESTIHAQMPWWIEWISGFIMQHTAHHVNTRIPLYHLAGSQRCLERVYADHIVVQPWRFTALGNTLARCKLYDYDNHRWLNFKGRPTTEANVVMRDFKARGLCRRTYRSSNDAAPAMTPSAIRSADPAAPPAL